MKGWRDFWAGSNRSNNEQTELERDVRFADRLERLGSFRARPEFQADLRTRLQAQIVGQTTPKVSWVGRFMFQVASAGLGLAALLIFAVALWSDSNPAYLRPSNSVAVAPSVIPAQSADAGLNYVYDMASSDFVDLEAATKTLGFTPSLPENLPEGYRLENIALAYGENSNFGRVLGRPNSITLTPNSSANPAKPYGFQFQLVSSKEPDKNNAAVQVYQLAAPFGAVSGPRFDVSGAQKFYQQKVQGLPAYVIQGSRWRVNFVPPVPGGRGYPAQGTPPAAARPPTSITPGSPAIAGNKRPPFAPPGFEPGKRPPTPPAGVGARVAFGQMPENNNPNRARPFIDFQPRADGQSARSLVFQKEGVLIVLVGSDSIAEDELHRLAETFK